MADRARSTLSFALILITGAALRIAFWSVNPPNNAYDDHLAPIALFAREATRPAPGDCWQCYQPPLYYLVSALTLQAVFSISDSSWAAWRVVQLQNVLYSLITVCTAYWIAERLGVRSRAGCLVSMSVVALMPVDIFASAIVGNDPLLSLSVSVAVLIYLRVTERGERAPLASLLLLAACTVCSLVKQSGLLSPILFVGLWASDWRSGRLAAWGGRHLSFLLVILGCLVIWSDEIWRTLYTGRFLVSNQHFFPGYTAGQSPGDLSRVSWGSLRLAHLFSRPWIDPQTINSFWTGLFARMWFDYEPKLVNPGLLSGLAAGAAYTGGLAISGFWLAGLILFARSAIRVPRYLPVLAFHLAFVLVPIAQTLRFPYFSSMKAVFLLPGVTVGAAFVGLAAERLWAFAWGRTIIVASLAMIFLACVTYAGVAAIEIDQVLARGPVWKLPSLP